MLRWKKLRTNLQVFSYPYKLHVFSCFETGHRIDLKKKNFYRKFMIPTCAYVLNFFPYSNIFLMFIWNVTTNSSCKVCENLCEMFPFIKRSRVVNFFVDQFLQTFHYFRARSPFNCCFFEIKEALSRRFLVST